MGLEKKINQILNLGLVATAGFVGGLIFDDIAVIYKARRDSHNIIAVKKIRDYTGDGIPDAIVSLNIPGIGNLRYLAIGNPDGTYTIAVETAAKEKAYITPTGEVYEQVGDKYVPLK